MPPLTSIKELYQIQQSNNTNSIFSHQISMETGYSSARDKPGPLQAGLFPYPQPPPQQYMNVTWISQEYDHLVKETMKANEKLLPLLMKRKFDGTQNTSPRGMESTVDKLEPMSARGQGGNRRQQMIESFQHEYLQGMRQSTNIRFRSRDRRYKQLSINENPTKKLTNSTVIEGELSTSRRLNFE